MEFETRSCTFGPIAVQYDRRVLQPREWTLRQSEWAAEECKTAPAGRLLELCAGAGHIGLAAAVLADRDLVQVEADPVAAGYARRNAEAVGWADRVQVRAERLQGAVRPGERFPVILADPPYLPSWAVQRWPEDPPTAIDGGPDGLDLVRDCLTAAAAALTPGGRLLLQLAGPAQAEQLGELLDPAGLVRSELRVTDEERAILLLTAGR